MTNWFSFLSSLNPNSLAIHLALWALSAIAIFGGGTWVGWETKSAFVNAAEVDMLKHDREVRQAASLRQRQVDAVASTIAIKAAIEGVRLKGNTTTIIREIHDHVTTIGDRMCKLPVGFNRVYDASLRGESVDSIPLPAGANDNTASGLPLSVAAAVIASNNGTCLAFKSEDAAWREWYNTEVKLFNSATTLVTKK